ncbi:hypothetical protein EYZ11_000509 [Aspergillus tanneri]|uniref:Uncharacterized protein n=1 Tax=Aspergillus tanneri TaxID=1220188 RepID=A0A4S3JX14_9EURO|nr:hypothetical protein EYZ11_000509 [Aspergillus tanneri]
MLCRSADPVPRGPSSAIEAATHERLSCVAPRRPFMDLRSYGLQYWATPSYLTIVKFLFPHSRIHLHPLVDLAAEIHHNIQTIDHHPLTAFYLPDFIVTNLRLAPPPLRKWDWGKSLSSIVDFHHLERRESVDSVPSYRCVSESQRDGTPLWRVRVNLDPVAMERLQQDRLLGGLEKWPT